MNEVKEEAALSERQIEEAREWVKSMIDNNLLPIMNIAKLAGIQSAAVISKFYHDHHLSNKLTQRTATKILEVKDMFGQVSSFKLNHPTAL